MTAITLSRAQRKDQVRKNTLALIVRPPPGWEAWGVHRAREFKNDCETVAKDSTSLPKLLIASSRLAAIYGSTMAVIDPMRGQP